MLRGDPVRGMSPTEAAAFWLVRHDRDAMTSDEHAAFRRWLAASPNHEQAWERASQLWDAFDPSSDQHLKGMRNAALAHRASPLPRIGAWAGGLAACAACVLLFTPLDEPQTGTPLRETAAAVTNGTEAIGRERRYRTARGERLSVTLADETVLTLDTDTVVDVLLEPHRRTVRLSRGQALFEVAKDPQRPFMVEAGDKRVTALGTVFDVSLNAATMKVVLVEGKVAVTDPRLRRRDSTPVVLRPGQGLTMTGGQEHRVDAIDVEAALLWKNGLISLENVTLADAVAQLNRYSSRQMTVSDPAVAALRVSGVFRTGAPELFVNSVAEVLPIAARATPSSLQIVSRG
jgi:transmembrane sensor